MSDLFFGSIMVSNLLIGSIIVGVLTTILCYIFSFFRYLLMGYEVSHTFALGIGVGNALVAYICVKTTLL